MSHSSQKQDKQLMLAYHKGIMDERKEWKVKEKTFNRLKYQQEINKEFCMCRGIKRWRRYCGKCQDWLKEQLKIKE